VTDSIDKQIAAMPGLKEDALIRLGACAVCRQPMLASANASPTFYTVTIARGIFDVAALQRRTGLQMMFGGGLGSGALARAMGPNDDLAKIYAGAVEVIVHETCAGDIGHLAQLMPEAPDTPAEDDPAEGVAP
jgi:hypothetical protein